MKFQNWLVVSLLAIFGTTAFARNTGANETITGTLTFNAGDGMFYLMTGDNQAQLESIMTAIRENIDNLKDGSACISVRSYYSSESGKTALTRALRVKSKLITDAGAAEYMFRTRILNQKTDSGLSDVVVIALPLNTGCENNARPAVTAAAQEKGNDCADEIRKLKEENLEIRKEADASVAEARLEAEEARAEAVKVQEKAEEQVAAYKQQIDEYEALEAKREAKSSKDYHLALRANLLRWATLTPDLGIEWRISPSIGIGFNGTYTYWSWEDWNKHYDMWEIRPEIKWYLGGQKNFYVGAMFNMGEFNYKISWLGYNGSLIGGGALIGYQLRLSDAFSMDFGLGLGAEHVTYDKYWYNKPAKVNVYEERNTVENVWGLTHLGVTLVWTIF